MKFFYCCAVLLAVSLLAEECRCSRVMEAVVECLCTAEYRPVCGIKNGRFHTYGNRCKLDCDSAIFAHTGECRVILQQKADNQPGEGYALAYAKAFAQAFAQAYAEAFAQAFASAFSQNEDLIQI